MNVSDVIEPAEFYTGVEIEEDDEKVMIVNKGINRINTLGLAYGEDEIDVHNSDYIQLNDEAIGVAVVLNEQGNKFDRWKFRRPKDIAIAKNGTYYVIYRRMAGEVGDLEEEIPLPRVYLTPLIKYAEAHIKLQMHDNSPDGQRLMNHFERLATEAYNNLVLARIPADIRTSQVLSGMLAGTAGGVQDA